MKHSDVTKKGYTGYVLHNESRGPLTKLFPQEFPKLIGHHITHKFGVTADQVPDEADAQVVGHAVGDGIEALVVSINGSTDRPDGSTYHITWSLDPDKKKPKDSNDLLKNGWEKLPKPIDIKVSPKFFSF